jgi:hypothetical protein
MNREICKKIKTERTRETVTAVIFPGLFLAGGGEGCAMSEICKAVLKTNYVYVII